MITSEMLHEFSTKHHLQLTLAHASDNGWLEDFLSYHRHPDTIVGGVLSVVQVDALWLHTNPEMLVHVCGITHWTNHEAVFLTDDSQFGQRVLRDRGWAACSFRHRGTARSLFDSWAQMVSTFARGKRLLETEADLLEYINKESEK